MKTVCFLLCVVGASCVYIENDRGQLRKGRILQRDFTKIENVPYQASILESISLTNTCGAVIIDKSWILTCSHCIQTPYKLNLNVTIQTGTGRRKGSGILHKIEKMIIHPNYTISNENNDIALIKLAEPIKFSKEQSSIPIANSSDIPREGQQMLISGFGRIAVNLNPSEILRSANVTVRNDEDCIEAYGSSQMTDKKFCAGDEHADACEGDSGGPAVINGKLYGIISGGIGCGLKEFPGVYMRVHQYYDWIVNTTGLKF